MHFQCGKKSTVLIPCKELFKNVFEVWIWGFSRLTWGCTDPELSRCRPYTGVICWIGYTWQHLRSGSIHLLQSRLFTLLLKGSVSRLFALVCAKVILSIWLDTEWSNCHQWNHHNMGNRLQRRGALLCFFIHRNTWQVEVSKVCMCVCSGDL